MTPFLPMEPGLLESALAVFSRVAGLMTTLVGTAFLVRSVLLLISFAPAGDYASILRSVVIYFAGVSLFPSLLHVLMEVTGSLASAIPFPASEAPTGVLAESLGRISKSLIFSGPAILHEMGILYLARAVYGILLALLIGIAPVVIFVAVLLQGAGLSAFLTAFVTLALWPVLWNILGALAFQISRDFEVTSLSRFLYWIVVYILQLFSPVFAVFLFKSFSVGAAMKAPLHFFVGASSLGMKPRSEVPRRGLRSKK